MHENFVDLNPGYAEFQKKKQRNYGRSCVRQLGDELKDKIRTQKRALFNKRFESGERLPYEEILTLTDKTKRNY